ncbi:MAG: sodium:alanine symporter family protein [Simkaniaceae bacterium]|nr:sodium:alanine symporter family protein [Simkaniaceae bacterium]MCF7852049.1 sodium:alanine symporter family protein [Simkaniaceae bacterium]
MEKTLIWGLETFNYFFWNHCLFVLLAIVGIIYTVRLRGVQFTYFIHSLKLAFSKEKDKNAEGDISQFQSLMTALAATIGIASIAGVATAIVAGGFGAVFWMWVIALIGMATKFAEAILAVKFRMQDRLGMMCGGPMYYIQYGLGKKWLGVLFAIFGVLASFAGGNLIQSNSIAHAIGTLFEVPGSWTGIILSILTFLVLMRGISSIGKISAYLVPFMALTYLLVGFGVIGYNYDQIIPVFKLIFQSAFSGQAAVGGFLGSTVTAALQYGISRGISSSEAGLGSAPIAAAAARTDEPGTQALISMIGTFLSVILVCSITAFAIGVTGVLGQLDGNGNVLNGVALVMAAFKTLFPFGNIIVAIGVILFGYSTILGWAYYGEKCIEYLFKEKSIFYFRVLFCMFVFIGAILHLDLVWPIVDLTNGLMALPNLIALFGLSNVVTTESRVFFKSLRKKHALS